MIFQFAKNNSNFTFAISNEPKKKNNSKYEDYKETKVLEKCL
jgi:hypothetical protein